ncbi:hypothetical protein LINPERHAP1_LOCUS23328 [Linum perenne]
MGFGETTYLGRYLGVPILHGKASKDTYAYILKRMRRKLEGWKCNTLSLAGRVTLALSVLNSIPSYEMQHRFSQSLSLIVLMPLSVISFGEAPLTNLKFTYYLGIVFVGLRIKEV